MVAGLGLEVAEVVHQRGADLLVAALVGAGGERGLAVIAVVAEQVGGGATDDVPLGHHLAQARIEVLGAATEAQHPCLVVDAGADVADLLVRHSERAGQHPGGALHAVAQSDGLQAERVQVAGGHRHRVRVVDEDRVRAHLEGVGGDRLVRRHRAQEPEDPTGTDGVAHGLVDTVLPRDLHVPSVRLHPTHLEGDDHEVGVGQSRPAVGGLDDLGVEPVVRDQLAGRIGDRGELLGVDVHQAQPGVAQGREAEQVADEPEREDVATGADDGDLGRGRHGIQPRNRAPRRHQIPFGVLPGSSDRRVACRA